MIEKGRISAFQMAIMMYPTILATAVITLPTITAKYAKQDMWLSPVWASFVGLFTVYITGRLDKLYPQETIIQYSGHILGRIPGKILGFIYLLFYLHNTGIIAREFGDFVFSTFLTLTPIIVIIGSMALVFAFAVRGGIEVLARSAQIFVPINTVLIIVIFILLIPDLKTKNILPVMEEGILPSIKGAIAPQGWFSEYFLISFLMPFLVDREKGIKWGMISVLAVTLTMILVNIMVLLLFGESTANLTYPVTAAARYISIAGFFEHLEVIVMAIWVTGTFVKMSVFYYALVLGTAQWLNLSDYRPIVLPLGFLVVLISTWSASNMAEMGHFLEKSDPFYLTTAQTVIPLLLLLIAVVRNKWVEKT
ncbi:GerAB/ArcD/ProY family transporter [Effusibacillus pohliae]|uniref:GerAB/ArcD/ProY family transporter n=1 Tax=Effusibacillus pohliae TaxID=232270 RepID=UPI000361E225|nr:endospore germination permease [Effusibacillus pohliae]